jgi:hypothetical protein
MKRTFVAGLLAAIFLLMLGAPLASAFKFNAQSYTATVNGVQGGVHAPPPPEGTSSNAYLVAFENHLMTECKTATFKGELASASTSLTVSPAVSECSAFGALSATVNMNGCQYRFNPLSGGAGEFSGSLDILCPEGKKIVISGNGCEIQIGSQNGLNGITFGNETQLTEPQLSVGFGVETKMTYSKTQDGIFCPLSGTGTVNDGSIAGGATFKAGNSEGKFDGLWIE